MTVRAKFMCNGVEKVYCGTKLKPGVTNTQDAWKDKANITSSFAYNVKLSAIYEGAGGDEAENKKFWEASPSGQLTMQTMNGAAAQYFESGKSYYLDFTECPTQA